MIMGSWEDGSNGHNFYLIMWERYGGLDSLMKCYDGQDLDSFLLVDAYFMCSQVSAEGIDARRSRGKFGDNYLCFCPTIPIAQVRERPLTERDQAPTSH